jgi:hypothetical protein
MDKWPGQSIISMVNCREWHEIDLMSCVLCLCDGPIYIPPSGGVPFKFCTKSISTSAGDIPTVSKSNPGVMSSICGQHCPILPGQGRKFTMLRVPDHTSSLWYDGHELAAVRLVVFESEKWGFEVCRRLSLWPCCDVQVIGNLNMGENFIGGL